MRRLISILLIVTTLGVIVFQSGLIKIDRKGYKVCSFTLDVCQNTDNPAYNSAFKLFIHEFHQDASEPLRFLYTLQIDDKPFIDIEYSSIEYPPQSS